MEISASGRVAQDQQPLTQLEQATLRIGGQFVVREEVAALRLLSLRGVQIKNIQSSDTTPLG